MFEQCEISLTNEIPLTRKVQFGGKINCCGQHEKFLVLFDFLVLCGSPRFTIWHVFELTLTQLNETKLTKTLWLL